MTFEQHPSSLNIAVFSASGRMGHELIAQVVASSSLQLVAAVTHGESASLGQSVSVPGTPADMVFVDRSQINWADIDVGIDFSLPSEMLENINLAAQHQTPMVIGSTGLDANQLQRLSAFSQSLPVFYAANFSVGVNLLSQLAKQAARVLHEQADVEIVETHHRYKRDNPSGTALLLGESVAAGLGVDLASQSVFGRATETDVRPQQQIGFHAVRGGDVVGDHQVIFACDGERIELSHRASSRATFAIGAVRAAAWLATKPAGFYGMSNLLAMPEKE